MINTMIINTVEAVGSIGGSGVTGSCGSGITTLTSLINFFTCTLMNAVVPLLMALSVVGFVYGIIQYFLNPDNEEKRKAGKSFMLWGLVALFVIVSIWGLVGILSNTFLGSSHTYLPSLPESK